MDKNGQLRAMASRIASISRRAGEKAIIIAYSMGNAVTLKLLQLATV
jgi:pimeloyl-ACP methyl ester carboxylesterase